jgi:hypothetical protein
MVQRKKQCETNAELGDNGERISEARRVKGNKAQRKKGGTIKSILRQAAKQKKKANEETVDAGIPRIKRRNSKVRWELGGINEDADQFERNRLSKQNGNTLVGQLSYLDNLLPVDTDEERTPTSKKASSGRSEGCRDPPSLQPVPLRPTTSAFHRDSLKVTDDLLLRMLGDNVAPANNGGNKKSSESEVANSETDQTKQSKKRGKIIPEDKYRPVEGEPASPSSKSNYRPPQLSLAEEQPQMVGGEDDSEVRPDDLSPLSTKSVRSFMFAKRRLKQKSSKNKKDRSRRQISTGGDYNESTIQSIDSAAQDSGTEDTGTDKYSQNSIFEEEKRALKPLAQQPLNSVAESYLQKTSSAINHFVQSSARAFTSADSPSTLPARVNDDDSPFISKRQFVELISLIQGGNGVPNNDQASQGTNPPSPPVEEKKRPPMTQSPAPSGKNRAASKEDVNGIASGNEERRQKAGPIDLTSSTSTMDDDDDLQVSGRRPAYFSDLCSLSSGDDGNSVTLVDTPQSDYSRRARSQRFDLQNAMSRGSRREGVGYGQNNGLSLSSRRSQRGEVRTRAISQAMSAISLDDDSLF